MSLFCSHSPSHLFPVEGSVWECPSYTAFLALGKGLPHRHAGLASQTVQHRPDCVGCPLSLGCQTVSRAPQQRAWLPCPGVSSETCRCRRGAMGTHMIELPSRGAAQLVTSPSAFGNPLFPKRSPKRAIFIVFSLSRLEGNKWNRNVI